jgi:hypothetical protein
MMATLRDGADATPWLVGAAGYDVVALAAAVVLSVFKPGKPFGSRSSEDASGHASL